MTTKAESGTLFSTGGDESWPVTYRIHVGQPGGDRTPISGTLEFPPGTRLGTLNPHQPVYLRLGDGRWGRLHLPVEPPDQTSYTIGDGSGLVDAPRWAEQSR